MAKSPDALEQIRAAMTAAAASKEYAQAVDRALRDYRRTGGALLQFRASMKYGQAV